MMKFIDMIADMATVVGDNECAFSVLAGTMRRAICKKQQVP